jgi:hypothetical protein
MGEGLEERLEALLGAEICRRLITRGHEFMFRPFVHPFLWSSSKRQCYLLHYSLSAHPPSYSSCIVPPTVLLVVIESMATAAVIFVFAFGAHSMNDFFFSPFVQTFTLPGLFTPLWTCLLGISLWFFLLGTPYVLSR